LLEETVVVAAAALVVGAATVPVVWVGSWSLPFTRRPLVMARWYSKWLPRRPRLESPTSRLTESCRGVFCRLA
jgi:hypothetical protein